MPRSGPVPTDSHTHESELCAERALKYVALYHQAKAGASFGPSSKRTLYRQLAARYERIVGVWMAIGKTIRQAAADKNIS